jgi:hypothetical protein
MEQKRFQKINKSITYSFVSFSINHSYYIQHSASYPASYQISVPPTIVVPLR